MDRSVPKLLIVDDEPDILFVLKRTFLNHDYVVEIAENGVEAIDKLKQNTFHVVLLDLNMHPVTGLDVLKELRKLNQETVVIILTAHQTVDSAIEALRLGAFDYLVKPAEPESIRQRIAEGVKHYEQLLTRAKLRDQLSSLQQTLMQLNPENSQAPENPVLENMLQKGDLKIDFDHHNVQLKNMSVHLTTTEYKILICLAQSAPQPVNCLNLVQAGLGYETNPTEAGEIIKYHIHQLRQKIESDPARPKYIKTIRYEGYLWCS